MVIGLAAFRLCVLVCISPVSWCETLQGDVATQKNVVDGGAADSRLMRREVVKSGSQETAAHEGWTAGSDDMARANSSLQVRQKEVLESIHGAVSTGSIVGRNTAGSDTSGKMIAEAMPSADVDRVDMELVSTSLVEGSAFEDVVEQSTAIGNRLGSWMTVNGSTLTIEPKKISVFCFGWTARRPGYEEDNLDEIRKQFAACDGSAIFTDEEAVGPDLGFIKVSVPKQHVARHIKPGTPGLTERDNKWLWHRNMAGIMQAWKYLLEQNVAEKYDWILNTEFDHFVRPSQVRYTIADHMQTLWAGSPDERLRVGKAMLLMWGNAFVFSNEAVHEMKRQWPTLGKTMNTSTEATGCPDWMEGHSFWPQECAQDIVYPIMAMVMNPPIAAYGAAGCGQQPRNALGKDFELPCYQMSNSPIGDSESGQLKTVRAIAENHTKDADAMVLLEAHGDAGPALPVKFERGAGEGAGEGTEVEKETEKEAEAEGVEEQASKYAAKIDTILERAFALTTEVERAQRMRQDVILERLTHYRRQLDVQKKITWHSNKAKAQFLPNFHTPIYHQVYFLSVHKLGREILGL